MSPDEAALVPLILAAIVFALIVKYQRARERNRDYCLKQAVHCDLYSRIHKVTGRDESEVSRDQQQSTFWRKRAKSFIPITSDRFGIDERHRESTQD